MVEKASNRLFQIVRSYWFVLLLVLVWSTVLAAYAITRHERLNSSAFDLAIKSQVIWNTYQGDWFASSIEVGHYLGDHVQFIFLLLAPFFGLWEDVGMMLIIQAAMLSLGAIPIYRIALRKLNDSTLANVFVVVYLLYPLVGFVNRFDFHPLTFTILLFLLAFDLLETDHPWWASLFILLALSIREDVGFTVFAFGLYAAVFMGYRRLGLLWAITGLIYSLTAIFVIIPTFRGGASDTMGRYAWLGGTLPTMLRTLVTQPKLVLVHLTWPFRLLFLIKLLLPLGFLSLLSPAPLLIALPALAYNMLSETASQSSIYFQYLAPIVPFIFIAGIQGTARVQHWITDRNQKGGRRKMNATWLIAGWLFIGTFIAWAWDNPFTKPINAPYFPVYGLEQITDRDAFHEAVELLPADAAVATMMGYAPHVALRPELDLFYDRLKLEQRPYGFPQTEYLLLNLSDLRWGVNARFFYAAIETAIGQFGYEVIYAKNDVVLLQQTATSQPGTGAVLQRVTDLLEAGGKYAPAAQTTIDWMGHQWVTDALPDTAVAQTTYFIDPSSGKGSITLAGYEMPTESAPGEPLCVTLYWQTDTAVDVDYTVFLHLIAPDGFVQAQRDSSPAFGFYPTTKWQAGETVGDMHCFQLPPGLAPDEYGIKTGLYDPNNGDRLFLAVPNTIELDAVTIDNLNVKLPTN